MSEKKIAAYYVLSAFFFTPLKLGFEFCIEFRRENKIEMQKQNAWIERDDVENITELLTCDKNQLGNAINYLRPTSRVMAI